MTPDHIHSRNGSRNTESKMAWNGETVYFKSQAYVPKILIRGYYVDQIKSSKSDLVFWTNLILM